jgi:hypothetical protein
LVEEARKKKGKKEDLVKLQEKEEEEEEEGVEEEADEENDEEERTRDSSKEEVNKFRIKFRYGAYLLPGIDLSFVSSFLDLDKVFPNAADHVRKSIKEVTKRFSNAELRKEGASLSDMLRQVGQRLIVSSIY